MAYAAAREEGICVGKRADRVKRETHGFDTVRFLLLFDDSFGGQAEANEFDDIFWALAAGCVAF